MTEAEQKQTTESGINLEDSPLTQRLNSQEIVSTSPGSDEAQYRVEAEKYLLSSESLTDSSDMPGVIKSLDASNLIKPADASNTDNLNNLVIPKFPATDTDAEAAIQPKASTEEVSSQKC